MFQKKKVVQKIITHFKFLDFFPTKSRNQT